MRRLLWIAALFCLGVGNLRADKAPYEAGYGLINVGGIIVFFDSQGPLSFNTLTFSELPAGSQDAGTVRCRSCQHGLSIPVFSNSRRTNVSGAAGNGSFQKAMELLRKERPEIRGIYDVKVDLQKISVLGVYQRLCTEVEARGFR